MDIRSFFPKAKSLPAKIPSEIIAPTLSKNSNFSPSLPQKRKLSNDSSIDEEPNRKIESGSESKCDNPPDIANSPELSLVDSPSKIVDVGVESKLNLAMSTPATEVTIRSSCASVKQSDSGNTENFTYNFSIGETYNYEVLSTSATAHSLGYTDWFDRFYKAVRLQSDSSVKAVVGLDCEWCAPWFREKGEPERVATIQLYSPHADAMVFSTCDLVKLPPLFEQFLDDPSILKVGVNICGDAARIARDFGCSIRGLVNVSQGERGKKSMAELCNTYCPEPFHINKDTVENGVRMGNWKAWPLSELQIRYAALDACLSFAIFLFQMQGRWEEKGNLPLSTYGRVKTESVHPPDEKPLARAATEPLGDSSDKHSNFFLMHRNKSITPPNLGSGKERPRGPKDSLSKVCVVISGVLDSMSREDMTTYVEQHGGRVVKAITKAVTHLINDVEGTVGPAKVEKCRKQGIPIVGEDVIFEMVRSRTA
jgi:hypothetical protein